MTNKTYTPAEICEMFGIAKTTLFRWEQEDGFPKVRRDLSGQREYTQAHIKAISERQIEKLAREYEQAAKVEDVERLEDILEATSFLKFLQGNETGLREMEERAESRKPSPDVTRRLVRTAYELYDPTDPIFTEILEVALEQSRALRPG